MNPQNDPVQTCRPVSERGVKKKLQKIDNPGMNPQNDPVQTCRPDLITADMWGMVDGIARMIAGRLPQVFDLDDLRGAGLLGLVMASATFDSVRGVPFSTYAYARIRGSILDSVRRRRYLDAMAEPLSEEHVATGADPAEIMSQERRCMCVREAILRLPYQQAHIISSYYFQGRSLSDMADEMGISTGRVSQIHGRALRILHQDPELRAA